MEIADINIDSFENMVKEIFPDEKRKILDKLLSEDKEICLKYIEALVKTINSQLDNDEEIDKLKNDTENTSFILGYHIKLLCEFDKKDEILEALQKNHLYPYQECLNLCIDNHVYDAIIYLYQLNGELSMAVKICLDRIDEAFKQLLADIDKKKISNVSEIDENYWKKMEKYLKKGIEVCENNSKGNEDEDDIWFSILNKLFDCEKKLGENLNKNKDNELNKSLIKHMQDINLQNINDLMDRMCSYVKITRIMNVVSERNKNAGLKEFKELIKKILNNYSSQTNIFYSTRNLLSNTVFENETLFQELNQKGELIDRDKCDKYKKEFNKNLMNKEKILVFNCEHIFHKSCTIKETQGQILYKYALYVWHRKYKKLQIGENH